MFADVTSIPASACSTLPAVDPTNYERHVQPRIRPLLSAVCVFIYEMHAILMNAQILVSIMASRARGAVANLLFSTGHSGKHGHEFLEVRVLAMAVLRYANNSNYRNDSLIRKESESGTSGAY